MARPLSRKTLVRRALALAAELVLPPGVLAYEANGLGAVRLFADPHGGYSVEVMPVGTSVWQSCGRWSRERVGRAKFATAWAVLCERERA